MVDTAKSITDLLASFPDNTTGLCTPQNLRDFVESFRPKYGSYYFTTPIETVIATVSTPVKALGTTTAVNLAGGFSMSTDNRLLYSGSVDVHAHIACSLSFTAAANNKKIGVMLAKNGAVIPHSLVYSTIGTGTYEGSTALHADVMLTSTDYLEIWIENSTDSVNATIQHGYLFALGMVI